MNFFFGIKDNQINCEVQIPLFQNKSLKLVNYNLYSIFPNNGLWEINKINDAKNSEFFIIKNNEISNDKIFFIAKDKDLIEYDSSKLQNFNSYTDTTPAYRANLKIDINEGGFSSYQSEYPFEMAVKNGSILSPINTLLDKTADKNYVFIKNIFVDPISKEFDLFLINFKERKVIKKYLIKTNYMNKIEIDKLYIDPEVYLFTKDYLGVPIFVNIKDKHISFEHTHPPHEYILSEDKFKLVNNVKRKFNEIILQENN